MTRRGVLLVAAVAAMLLNSTAYAARPNIVFVYTDDQGPWALGVAGHPSAKTPQMDRLAREGAYLLNAFTTTPVCSPSRAGLFASRYGSEVHITDWINPKSEPELGLDPESLLWPEVLQQNGYATGLVGKWHLGVPTQFHPTKNGFDYFVGFLEGGTSPRDPTLEKDGAPQKLLGFTSDILTDHALGFIEQNRARPFLLCLHFRSPHAPYMPVSDQDWSLFRNLDPILPQPQYPGLDRAKARDKTREYLASVHEVDRNLGRLLDILERLNLAQNTVVIFTSDHGYNIGHHGIWHKGNGHWMVTDPPSAAANIPRGQRPNMFDTSIRVPCMIRWPAVIRPGTIVNNTVTNLDWYRTILAMCDLPAPPDVLVRGRNFLPLLLGQVASWSDDLYCEYSTHHQSKTHMRMFRTPDWKLVRDFLNPDRDELYHLAKDPDERTNLIGSEALDVKSVVESLHQRILENMRRLNDPVLSLTQKPG